MVPVGLLSLAGKRKKLAGQEPSPFNKLFIPCRNENKACGAGVIPGQQAIHTLPEREKSLRGRSHPRATSYSYPAGLRIKPVGQEPSQGHKLIIPCRIENKACWAGAIPGPQAIHTLPEREKSLRGRSHPWSISYSHPARMKIKLVGQESSLVNKLFIPCRIEKMASQAGAPYRSMHKQGERVTSFALSSQPIFSILKPLLLLSWKQPAFTMLFLPPALILPENPFPEKLLPELLPAFP